MTKEMNTSKTVGIKSLSEANRTFGGYLSTYGNKDRSGDVFKKGAFKEAVANRTAYPLLYQHDSMEIIGYLEAKEDNKGLYVTATLLEGNKRADEVYTLLKVGALQEMSIGFGIDEPIKDNVKKTPTGWSFIKSYIREGSVVITPCNPQAMIDMVKSLDEKGEIKLELDLDLESEPSEDEKIEVPTETEELIEDKKEITPLTIEERQTIANVLKSKLKK